MVGVPGSVGSVGSVGPPAPASLVSGAAPKISSSASFNVGRMMIRPWATTITRRSSGMRAPWAASTNTGRT